jgi:hypothetical protein
MPPMTCVGCRREMSAEPAVWCDNRHHWIAHLHRVEDELVSERTRADALRTACEQIGTVMGCACKSQPVCVGCIARNAVPPLSHEHSTGEPK